jgi:putative transposase
MFFFTATLADRRSSALTDHVAPLRLAVTATRREHPFTIDAVVNRENADIFDTAIAGR